MRVENSSNAIHFKIIPRMTVWGLRLRFSGVLEIQLIFIQLQFLVLLSWNINDSQEFSAIPGTGLNRFQFKLS